MLLEHKRVTDVSLQKYEIEYEFSQSFNTFISRYSITVLTTLPLGFSCHNTLKYRRQRMK